MITTDRVKQHRIYWTLDEFKKLATSMAHQMAQQGLRHLPQQNDRTGGALILDFLRIAQNELLPRERRRLGPDIQRQQFKPLWPKVEVALTANGSLPHAALVAEVKTVTVKAPTQVEVETKQVEVETAQPLGGVEAAVALVRQIFANSAVNAAKLKAQSNELADLRGWRELIIDEMSWLKQQLAGLKGLNPVPVPAPVPFLPETPREKLPTVAIVGCRRYEFQHIIDGTKKAHLRCNFVHYDQDSQVRSIHADYAIAMKWANHGWQDQMDIAIKDRARNVFTNGGVTSVVKQLTEWFGQTPAKSP